MNKTTSKILLISIKILALLGAVLSLLSLGGRTYGLRFPKNTNYAAIVGAIMIAPYIIYLFLSKPKQKQVLKSNPKDLNRMGLTTLEYFEKTSKESIVEIYVKNETSDTLIINRKSLLKPNSWYIFTTYEYKPIYLSNGIEFHVDNELNLEVIDFRNQITGLGDDYFRKHHVPEYVNWAFVIGEPNSGDAIE